MLKCERWEVMNFQNAIRGARNPMNSWDKSDSKFLTRIDDDVMYHMLNGTKGIYNGPVDEREEVEMGPNDLGLLQRLIKAGADHRKFMRQILVSVDITAPIYWWKEYDTYKVSTVANSTSTMHKIHTKEFKLEDFSHDHLTATGLIILNNLVRDLEYTRLAYLEQGKPKELWYDLIQLLPCSYNQMRTCTLNYEALINMYHARKNHKLVEWHTFCDWVESLPYAKELILGRPMEVKNEN